MLIINNSQFVFLCARTRRRGTLPRGTSCFYSLAFLLHRMNNSRCCRPLPIARRVIAFMRRIMRSPLVFFLNCKVYQDTDMQQQRADRSISIFLHWPAYYCLYTQLLYLIRRSAYDIQILCSFVLSMFESFSSLLNLCS